jgi:hypothetical protein
MITDVSEVSLLLAKGLVLDTHGQWIDIDQAVRVQLQNVNDVLLVPDAKDAAGLSVLETKSIDVSDLMQQEFADDTDAGNEHAVIPGYDADVKDADDEEVFEPSGQATVIIEMPKPKTTKTSDDDDSFDSMFDSFMNPPPKKP